MRRLVLDTNVLISASLINESTPYQALLKARSEGIILASKETLAEFERVLLQSKFDKQIERSVRQGIFNGYFKGCMLVEIAAPVRACRDPRDDKFLEVAVDGQADAIITGDQDLLMLDPFRGIRILSPADFLEW